jgi:hypothetical protein
MNVQEIFNVLDDEIIDQISAETKVDHQVKLHGKVVLQLLIMSILTSDKLSYRVMEKMTQHFKFKQLSNRLVVTKFNSLRDRICSIKVSFFEKIFKHCFEKFNAELKEEKESLVIIDSTLVSIASNLVDWGLSGGANDGSQRLAKYTVQVKDGLPFNFNVYTAAQYASDNVAFSEAINANIHELDNSIVVFDRGMNARKHFDSMTSKDVVFVTRLSTFSKYKIVTNFEVKKDTKIGELNLIKDMIVTLNMVTKKRDKSTPIEYRLIEAEKDGTTYFFLSNNLEFTAEKIAEIYKKRWSIEVFFKFLKQYLNLKHISSRNQNGLEVMLYATLITAMLVLVYKRKNKLKGYKILLIEFINQLDTLLLRQIVLLTGGNPSKAPHIFGSG